MNADLNLRGEFSRNRRRFQAMAVGKETQPTPAFGHPSGGGESNKSPPVEGCRNGGAGYTCFAQAALTASASRTRLSSISRTASAAEILQGFPSRSTITHPA